MFFQGIAKKRQRKRFRSVVILFSVLFMVVQTVPLVHAMSSAWATPQPSCDNILYPFDQPHPACDIQVGYSWTAANYHGTDIPIKGVRVTITFPNTSPSVIPSYNELGAGIAVHVPSANPNTADEGVDFVYYGFVNVGHDAISLMSSGWVTCEWKNCASLYTQSCYTSSDPQTNYWITCPGTRHWQVFADRFPCSGCSVSDVYQVQMLWTSGGVAIWNYYRNGTFIYEYGFAMPTNWQVGTYFKMGTGKTCPVLGICYPEWNHLQFGVTMITTTTSENFPFGVDMANAMYLNWDYSFWIALPNVRDLTGQNAWIDSIFKVGFWQMPAKVVGQVSGCSTDANFSYSASATAPNGDTLWGDLPAACTAPGTGGGNGLPTGGCCGGGGGSVASETLITMSDGSELPVQTLSRGDGIIMYDVYSGASLKATITTIHSVTVDNMLTIHTENDPPLRVDVNPHLKFYVLTSNGPILKPVTLLRPGDLLYSYYGGSWVPVTQVSATYGGIHTYYDIDTNPKFNANGQLLSFIANGIADPCIPYCKSGPTP